MRPTFGREYIENEFQRIADGLSSRLTVYLVGGGAMSLRDLKGATKDIDLVVADGDAYGQLWAVLMDLGYAEVQSLDDNYHDVLERFEQGQLDDERLDVVAGDQP
jgi:hypothetical protein